MNTFIFAKRNVLNFFRDKAAIFFSLLAALITIGLYVLFLGDLLVNQMSAEIFADKGRFLIDSWIMAGVISITSISSAMGAYEAMVNDKVNKTLKDFYSAPLKKREIVAGYILSSFTVGMIMSLIALVFSEFYILIYGGSFLPLFSYVKMLGVILLSVLSSCSIMFFIVSFFKTSTAFATGSTVVGTLLGFVAGVYIPIGQFPAAVQTVLKFIPISHSSVLMRQIMMTDTLNSLNISPEYLSEFNLQLGLKFEAFGTTLTPLHSILFIAFITVLFFGLSVIKLSKKGNE